MALPKLAIKTYSTQLPTTKQTVEYRAYTVKEEKAMLMASQSEKPAEQMLAVFNMVNSCIVTENIDCKKIAQADLEWMFLQIRAISVGETTKIGHTCKACSNEFSVEIDISSIKPLFKDGHVLEHLVNETVGMRFKLPTAEMAINQEEKSDIAQFFHIVEQCVTHIWDGDTVYKVGMDITLQEVSEFIEQLDQITFNKILEATFSNAPKISHQLVMKCPKCKESEEITVEGLLNFFS